MDINELAFERLGLPMSGQGKLRREMERHDADVEYARQPNWWVT